MLKKILAAYDGSEPAARAFQMALELAQPLGTHILVVSVAQPPEPPMLVENEALLDSAAAHFEKDFNHFREEARTRNVPLETRVVVGHAADQIIQIATDESCDLIVMGHRGKSVLLRWLLGSISKRVLSYAPCSVLIVR